MRHGWAAALTAIAALLGGCSDAPEVRYRVTVEVDDNGVTRSGSSVWALRLSRGGPVTPYNARFRGEAVTVDLGARGLLFALVVGRDANGDVDESAMAMLPERQFGDIGRASRGLPKLHSDRVEDIRAISRQVGGMAELDCSDNSTCPYLVRFRDIEDPRTLEPVDPADLSASFGPGVRLKSVAIRVTDEEVTTGLEEQLPWLNRLSDYRADKSNVFTNTLPRQIGALRRGTK